MRIIAIAGMIDAKLESKILPLQELSSVSRIYLVRRKKYCGKKIFCYSPPFKNIFTAEIYRFITLFYLCLFRRPDMIIAFGTVMHGIYAYIASKIFNLFCVQLVLGKNDLGTSIKKRHFAQPILFHVIKSGDAIIVRGENTRNILTNGGIPGSKIGIIPNLFDFSLFKKDETIEKKYDLVYTGILEEYKRIDLLLHIVALLKKDNPDISLAVAGDGSQKNSILKLIIKLELQENVFLLGTLSQKNISLVLNQSKIFVMTSQGEGLPMAMLEAMSCGLPVLVPDDADIPTHIMNGENGYLIKIGDIHGYTEKINLLLQDSSLYHRISLTAVNAMRLKEKEYSLENLKNAWQEVLALSCKD